MRFLNAVDVTLEEFVYVSMMNHFAAFHCVVFSIKIQGLMGFCAHVIVTKNIVYVLKLALNPILNYFALTIVVNSHVLVMEKFLVFVSAYPFAHSVSTKNAT